MVKVPVSSWNRIVDKSGLRYVIMMHRSAPGNQEAFDMRGRSVLVFSQPIIMSIYLDSTSPSFLKTSVFV